MTDAQIEIDKWVSRHDHLNISTMYSIFDWKEFELSYKQAFLESLEITVLLKKSFDNSRVVPEGIISVYGVCWN